MTIQLQKSMFFAAVLVASQWSAQAAEIRFQAEARVSRGIVRLGDVAEIVTDDEGEARLLEGIALVPAPAIDQPRLLKRQEAQQLLQLSGIKLREHHFSGAECTQLVAGQAPVVQTVRKASTVELIPTEIPALAAGNGRLQPQPIIAKETSAAARVSQAIVNHLTAIADVSADWQADVAFSPRVVQALEGKQILRVEGGVSPWIGRQNFMLLAGEEAAPVRLPIEAEISGTTKAVVVIRSVERGTTLTAQDLQMQTVSLKTGVRLVIDPAQLIGLETNRALNAGQLVGADMVRTVRLVKRGEEIQVVSIGAGVQISEPAKALADGTQGDSITVEFVDRRKMVARITGARRAEVYAMQTSRSQVEATSQPVRN
ncbi:flagellar basal body P-ring formation chaperone FlgA [Anatilimnocola sp. NA78]|uniref:flagellar basal body P-ring formation chaperone FlgA n=1 Tax=Anatilimnocola sp. NA78 TaxID=3415683 RepID=UPI003CE5719D